MSVNINDIIRHLQIVARQNVIRFEREIPVRNKIVVSVEYYLFVECFNYSADMVIRRYEQQCQEGDILHPYGGVDDLNEAIELCRQFCHNVGKVFNAAEEEFLREQAGNGHSTILIICERPIYMG